MSILTGFKRFKKFIKTDDGYMPSYDKTIASAVCFGDGTDDTDTVESRLSGIKGITTSNSVTETGYAADASVVSEISNDITEIQDNIDTLNSSLVTENSTVDILFHFSDRPNSVNNFYYTNSVYIPNNYELDVRTASFLGADGNFASQLTMNKRGNYVHFYSNNSAFAGLTLSVYAYMVKSN